MNMVLVGTMNGAATFKEVSARDLEVNQMYVIRIDATDDEGNPMFETDTCWVKPSTVKYENQAPKKLVRLTASGEGFYLSQLPGAKFFGPLKIEWGNV